MKVCICKKLDCGQIPLDLQSIIFNWLLCDRHWKSKWLINILKLYVSDYLKPLSHTSQINCTDNRDRLNISNMKYHSFSILDRYSAIIEIRQQFNFSSDLISVSLLINVCKCNCFVVEDTCGHDFIANCNCLW